MKSIYKADRTRIEDALIPALLESLMICHLGQLENKTSYDKALALLKPDIMAELKGSKSVSKRLVRVMNLVIGYFEDNGWNTCKCYMIVSALADALHLQGAVILGEGTQEVVRDITKIIDENYDDEEIKAQLESAQKQVPKVLRILQKEGYF
jgi:hypothetical protein